MRALLACLAIVASVFLSTHAHAAPPSGSAKPAGSSAQPDDKSPKGGAQKPPDDEPDPDDHTLMAFSVGIDVVRLSKLDVGPGSFEADFILSYRCKKEPCKPTVYLFNGDIKGKPELLVDDDLHKVLRVKADLDAEIDLKEFPFDKHQLRIEIGDRDALDVSYEVDKDHVPPPDDLRLPGWEITSAAATIESEDLSDGIKDAKFVYTMNVRRPVPAAVAKNFLPALTMVLVLFVSLFLKPKMAAARLAAGTGSFVGVIMFHNTAANQLPPLGIFTRLDRFMFTLYVIWLVHIALSIVILRTDESKNEARGMLIYKLAWGIVPTIALLGWALVFLRVV